MKQVLLCFFILFSAILYGQDVDGVLKGKLYIDSISNLCKDTFEICVYTSKDKELVSKSLESEKIKLVLAPGIYTIICANKSGMSITIENVKINYKAISFYDINVCSLIEKKINR